MIKPSSIFMLFFKLFYVSAEVCHLSQGIAQASTADVAVLAEESPRHKFKH